MVADTVFGESTRLSSLDGGMEREKNTKSQGSGAVVVCILMLVVLLPVLYVLSIGPLVRWYPNELPRWALVFYAPLIWLDENSEAFREFVTWYADLWHGDR